MTAHWGVLAAAALTTLVAAAIGAALAAFAGQALPQAVRHDLAVAPGTAVAATASIASGNRAQVSALLRSSIAAELGRVPFSFWQGTWSNPLDFVTGSRPASITANSTPVLEAAALDGVAAHAVPAVPYRPPYRPRCRPAPRRCSGCVPVTCSGYRTGPRAPT
jgi:hypothetical protein